MNGIKRLTRLPEKVPPYSLVLALSLAFFTIVSAAAALKTPVSATLLTILFYLLPAGVGLVVLPGIQTMARMGIRKSEHALLGYFVGLMVVALAVVARERNSSPELREVLFDPLMLDYALLGIGALGWIRALRQWQDYRGLDKFFESAIWCSPLFVVPYVLTFFVFSRYPLTDLFQFTHIMKGAEEFAGFDRINPFTADSYAPVIQAVQGSLLRLTGASSLDAIWLLPLPAYLLRAAVLYTVGSRLLREERSLVIFVAISLPFFGTGVLTNGELAALGSLLVMALMIATLDRSNGPAIRTWAIAIGVTGMIAVVLVAARSLPDWAIVCLFILGAILISVPRGRVCAPLLTMCLAIAAVGPLHRSTILLIPAVAISVAWAREPLLPRRAIALFSVALAAMGGTLVTAVLVSEYTNMGLPDPGRALTRWIDVLFGVSFSTSQDALLGTGAKVALFEIARSVGPLVALWSLALALPCLTRKTAHEQRGNLSARADATWMAACALIVLFLLGLPFAYRAVFVAVTLFSILIAQHFDDCHEGDLLKTAAGLIAYAAFIAAAEYGMPEASVAAEYYVNRAMPILLLCLVPVVAAGLALALRPRWARPAAALLVIWVVLFEKQVIRYHFFHYSFPGHPPPLSEPLSHYTLQDVQVSEWIRDNYGDGILVSDPYTLAITRALTGLNSIVTFSNLDTMNERAAAALKEHLQSILLTGQGASPERNCGEWNQVARLLSFGVSSESNYTLFQQRTPTLRGSDVLALFGYHSGLLLSAEEASKDVAIAENRHAWLLTGAVESSTPSQPARIRRSERDVNVITVINGRTIEWAFGTLAAHRHEGGEISKSSLQIREVLIDHCGAIAGPGDSVMLAHALVRK
jgi:hypothetical protein